MLKNSPPNQSNLPKIARPIPVPSKNLSPVMNQIGIVKFMVQSIDIQSQTQRKMNRLVSMLHDAASLIQSDKIVAENQDYFLQESSEEIMLAPIKSDLSKNVKKKLQTQPQSKEKIPADVLSIIKVMGYENFKTIQLPESKFWDEKQAKAVREIPEPERLLKTDMTYNNSPSQNLSLNSGLPCGTALNKNFSAKGPSNRLESLELVNASPQEIIRKFSALQSQGEMLFKKTSELAQNIERFL